MLLSNRDRGFTLVEVIVALGLFALVAAAGTGLVSTILTTQRLTESRLHRLGDIDRAMLVVGSDLAEIADAPLVGAPDSITFERHVVTGVVPIAYRLTGSHLERFAAGRPEAVLDNVKTIHWHYIALQTASQDHWPTQSLQSAQWPAAINLELTLAGSSPTGTVRRVIDLPSRPLPLGLAP